MQALILAGGKGTRLRPLTVYTPKPIVPICNRPFLLYQIDTLRRAGITDITLSLSYQPNKIEQLLGKGAARGGNLKAPSSRSRWAPRALTSLLKISFANRRLFSTVTF